MSNRGLWAHLRFLAIACLVVLVNNLVILWQAAAPGLQALTVAIKLLLGAALIAWTLRIEHVSPRELGFRLNGIRRSARYGLLAGLGMAVPSLLFVAFPLVISGPLRSSAFSVAGTALLPVGLLLVVVVAGAVAFEEFLFRGLIQSREVEWLGPVRGIAVTCLLFILWHVVSAYQGIEQTNLRQAHLPLPILYAAAAVPLGLAGAILSLLRYRTKNLAGSIVAHWLVVSLLQGVLLAVSARGPAA